MRYINEKNNENTFFYKSRYEDFAKDFFLCSSNSYIYYIYYRQLLILSHLNTPKTLKHTLFTVLKLNPLN